MSYDEKDIKLYLKRSDANKVELIGIFGILIISKELIKKNSEVADFIEFVLDLRLPEYVIKSRTLMMARTSRVLINMTDDFNLKNIRKKTLEYLDVIENKKIFDGQEKEIKKTKKKNENDKLKKWLEGL